MKSKFRYLLLALPFLFSCSLRTTRTEIDFLFSKFALNHAFDYQEAFMDVHTFIPIAEGTIRDSLFNVSENILTFYPLSQNKRPTFDVAFCLAGASTIYYSNIEYELLSPKNKEMRIRTFSNINLLKLNDNSVFPNFWLRIHFEILVDDINYNLILEYKNIGKTI